MALPFPAGLPADGHMLPPCWEEWAQPRLSRASSMPQQRRKLPCHTAGGPRLGTSFLIRRHVPEKSYRRHRRYSVLGVSVTLSSSKKGELIESPPPEYELVYWKQETLVTFVLLWGWMSRGRKLCQQQRRHPAKGNGGVGRSSPSWA